MEEPVALTIDYRAADFVSAVRWVALRGPRPYLVFALLGAGGFLLGYSVWVSGSPELGRALMIVVPFALLLGFALMLLRIVRHGRMAFEANQTYQYPIHWLLSTHALNIQGKGITATLELNNYIRADETAEGFLLWQTPQIYNYLPKRAIPDHATLERVRDIIRTGLPGTAKIDLRSD
ncbi:MAG: YcxB family protein [Planctomycetes bacterium]|nr:YcxB family protein [Planctomycetota bacterium]